MVAQLVCNLPVQASSDQKAGQSMGKASILPCVVEAMASMQTTARRATRRAASAGAAPRASSRSPVRARVPDVVDQKDSDGAMTLIEV